MGERTAVDCVIMDHIDRGHFDKELGAMTRDPKYAEYTAIEIKAVLTDRIANNMLPEHCYGLKGPIWLLVVILGALLVVAITYNVGG